MTTYDSLRQAYSDPGDTPRSGADIQTMPSDSLEQLLRQLQALDYRFITTTPATHARFVKRNQGRQAGSLHEVLGWNLPFSEETLPPEIFRLLQEAGAVSRQSDGLFSAGIRVSWVRGVLFIHSSFPTSDRNSVFLGPDSYRFADYILDNLADLPERAEIIDYGAGAGVGGITAGSAMPASRVTLADLNPAALKLAAINAQVAGVRHHAVQTSKPEEAGGKYDLFVTHPPFMMDEGRRAYRDGGDLYGARLSLDWALSGLKMLNPGGQLMMHTGVSIVRGVDVLLERLEAEIPRDRFRWSYRELDPDIFSEDLDTPPYAEVERIAATGLSVVRND